NDEGEPPSGRVTLLPPMMFDAAAPPLIATAEGDPVAPKTSTPNALCAFAGPVALMSFNVPDPRKTVIAAPSLPASPAAARTSKPDTTAPVTPAIFRPLVWVSFNTVRAPVWVQP